MKKSRKGKPRQHLEKVGTHTRDSARQEQHLEREAIADTMGFGGASPWVKWSFLLVGGVVVAVGLLVWILLF